MTGNARAQSSSDLLKLSGGMSSGQLMQLKQQMSSQTGADDSQTTTGQTGELQQTYIPQATPPQTGRSLPQSEIEKIYADRLLDEDPQVRNNQQNVSQTVTELRQFGYDQLGVGSSVATASVGGVLNDYVLGVGDEIIVSLRGQENQEYRVTVDRNGRILLPRMKAVVAAGLTFQDFRDQLEAEIQRAYVSTTASISIGHVRQINVLVSGDVNTPGNRTLSGLSTVVDALLVSGGVKKSGSLRNIRIIRNGRVVPVDLYTVLTGRGSERSLTLADGDRIVVPPVGATIAITGDMKRRGIFELPPDDGALSLSNAMALAGGPLMPGIYRISLLHQLPNGERTLEDVTDRKDVRIKKGEIAVIKLASDISLNQVSLRGAVRSPGIFALSRYKTLHDMLPSTDVLKPEAYMLFGFIDRIDRVTHETSIVPFSPLHVITGKENVSLQMDDKVHIFARTGVQDLIERVMTDLNKQDQLLLTGGKNNTTAGSSAQTTPAASPVATGATTSGATANNAATVTGGIPAGSNAPQGIQTKTNRDIAQEQSQEMQDRTTPTLMNQSQYQIDQNPQGGAYQYFNIPEQTKSHADDVRDQNLIYYRANISGAVQDPGIYLIAPGTTLSEAIIAAGGLKPDADLTDVEVTSTVIDNGTGSATTLRKNYSIAKADTARSIVLSPKDDVIFHNVYTNRSAGSVTIQGQVRYPGTYSLLRGEKLSSVLMRAGGLTEDAYPYGAVFMRQSVARLEKTAHEREAKQLEDMLITSMTRVSTDSQMKADSFTAMQGYITALQYQQSLGRMTVVADPKILARKPELDPMLEAGDKIYIPQHPYTVSVMGEVLQPTSIPYRKDRSANEYIQMAGGLSQNADDDEIFVVLPDGAAYRANQSWFDFGSRNIPPGSMIYVGRDVSGYDFRQGVIDVTKIFAQMATSLAAIAAISSD